MPSLSVVIPCYNAMPYIKRVIDSVLTQSYKYIDWVEMIIVDDCSTDDSCDYVEKMAAEAPRINEKVRIDLVRRQENSGNGALPRNDGILRAKGDYLFLIDSDDWFSPDSLDRMVRHAVEWNSDILLCKRVGENGRKVPQLMFRTSEPKVDIYTSEAGRSFSNLNLYRTKFLQDNQILNPSIGRTSAEDWSFIIEAYLRAETISIAADYVYYHVLKREDNGHLTQKLLGGSYNSEEWLSFWKQIFTVIEKYADTSKIYFKIIPRICDSATFPLTLRNMFSGSEPPENFLPIIALWNKWLDLERIRAAKGNINSEHSIIIQAARTENLEILRNAFEVIEYYRKNSRFPDRCVTAGSDTFTVSLEHSGGTYECDISKEIRFTVKDFAPPRYENGQFNFAARLEDYRSYLSENASIDLVFFDEKNSYREVFPMTKTSVADARGGARSVWIWVFPMARTRVSDAELTVRCAVDPRYFQDKYKLDNIRWDLYIEISSPLIGTRTIRVGNQGNKDALVKALHESLISQPFFSFRGYLSPANNIHFRQSPFPTLKVTSLSCSYYPDSQKLAVQGMLESVVDFHGDEELYLTIHSASKKTVLSHLTTTELQDGKLAWQGEFSVTNFLGLEPGKVRWDLSLQIKSFRLGIHSIRLGQQQAEIESLTSSIDALQLTKNEYHLKCYLSPYNNICFRQTPVPKQSLPAPPGSSDDIPDAGKSQDEANPETYRQKVAR